MTELTTIRLRPNAEAEIEIDVLSGSTPAYVFLHGMTSTRLGTKSDAVLAHAASRGAAFARPDFRGHGASDGELLGITMTDLIEDVGAVVGHVGRSVLIGSSMGALAASFYAVRHPEDLAALVLLAPAFGYLPEMARQAETYHLRRADDSTVVLRREVLQDARNYDESTLPERLECPVFVAHGTADGTVPWTRSDEFVKLVPHARKELCVVQDGSHNLSEAIDVVLARMQGFLDSLA